MKKLMTAAVVAACAANALAMPTKTEMEKAQPLVTELMAPVMAKFKAAGAKDKPAAAVEVGDVASEFAKAAETEAAKFLLLKGAVNSYAQGEAYEKAADAVAALQREVKDVPPVVIAEITGKATGRISESKAPRLYAFYRSAKLQINAANEAKALAVKLRKVQSDALRRKYAEALAVSGNWKAAYAEFAKVSDAKLKAVADAEANGNAKSAESGEFWWTYKPMLDDAEDFFKSHAAAYYRRALDAGEITGLRKNIVEQRLTQVEPAQVDAVDGFAAGGAQPASKQAKRAAAVDGKAISKAISNLGGCTSEEKAQKVVSALFPGWSLETKVGNDELGGFRAQHRGRKNVTFLPLVNRETPAAISRTVKLPNKNPCLFLSVSSFDKDCEGLLSVRVDGRDAMPFRSIGTTDVDPWEDLVVPLFAWRGRVVKIEIVHKADNWWNDHVFFSRIEIAEGNGREICGSVGIEELKAKVGGYTWSYRVKNGEAMIVSTTDSGYQCAVSPKPTGRLMIPAKLGGVKVTRLGRSAFWDCDGLESVTIPDGVTHLERDVFATNDRLTTVVMPQSVIDIGWGAFSHCKSLDAITIPESVRSIGPWAFVATRLKTVTIPACKIYFAAFGDCHELTSVTMSGEQPDAEKRGIFGNSYKLKTIHVPAKAKSWAGMKEWQGIPLVFDAGGRCTTSTENALKTATVGGLTWSYRVNNGEATIEQARDGKGNPQCAVSPKPTGSFTIPSALGGVKVTGIGEHAFFGCGGLTSVTIPSSVRSIGNGAFYFCSGLKSISIPYSATSLADVDGWSSAFAALNAIETFTVALGNPSYRSQNGLLCSKDGSKLIAGVVGEVKIPTGVTTIGHQAFLGRGLLTTVTIPASVKNIEDRAFAYCAGLTSVTMCGERPEAAGNVFQSCGKLKEIHVSAKAKSWAGMKDWQGIPLVFDAK